jgi:hypothetical protein
MGRELPRIIPQVGHQMARLDLAPALIAAAHRSPAHTPALTAVQLVGADDDKLFVLDVCGERDRRAMNQNTKLIGTGVAGRCCPCCVVSRRCPSFC